jgi:hypothetical protein
MKKTKRKAGGRLLMLKVNREVQPTKASSKLDTCGKRVNDERFGIKVALLDVALPLTPFIIDLEETLVCFANSPSGLL